MVIVVVIAFALWRNNVHLMAQRLKRLPQINRGRRHAMD